MRRRILGPLERILLGAAVSVLALLVERRLRKALRGGEKAASARRATGGRSAA